MKLLYAIIIALFIRCTSYTVSYDIAPSSQPTATETDSGISAIFNFTVDNIGVQVYNHTEHTAQIPWDRVVFVGGDGVSKRMIHSGIRYINKSDPQTPSVIAPQSTLNDAMVPADNVYYDPALGWMIHPVITAADIGKTVKIVMPVMVGDTTEALVYEYDVDDVRVTRH